MSVCQGTTLRGIPCSRKVRNGIMCYQHVGSPPRSSYMQDKPDDCLVCCESLAPQQSALTCGHWVHTECVIKSAKAECPICRHKLTFNRQITNRINNLAKLRQEEDLREEEEHLRSVFQYSMSEVIGTTLHRHLQHVVSQLLGSQVLGEIPEEDYQNLIDILGSEELELSELSDSDSDYDTDYSDSDSSGGDYNFFE